MKACSKCRNVQPLACFNRCAAAKTGYGSWCKTCTRAASSIWRKANPEIWAAMQRSWRSRNPDKAIKYSDGSAQKRWRENNPELTAHYTAKRKARKLHATPLWADRDAIAAIYVKAARLRDAGFDVDVDHVIPLQGSRVCGLHVAENLEIKDSGANRRKSNTFNP